MHPRFDELLCAARSGEEQDFQALLRALASDADLTAGVIAGYCSSAEPILRRAGIELAKKRDEPELHASLLGLVGDSDDEVRCALADAAREMAWLADAALVTLFQDAACGVREHAARACGNRPLLADRLLSMLVDDDNWVVRRAVAETLGQHDPQRVGPALLTAVCSDVDLDVAQAAGASLEQHLKKLGGYPAHWSRPPVDKLKAGLDRLRGAPKRCETLFAWLDERCRVEVDLEAARTFGTVLTEPSRLARLPHAYGVENAVAAVEAALQGAPPRAVCLLGESGVGKTAIIYELAHRLAARGWHLLQVSPADFLTGTMYLGEWQTRLSKLVAVISAPRQIVVYVPNLEELNSVGRSSSSDSNVASALAPSIDRGQIAIVGESTPQAFKQGLGDDPVLRKLFHLVAVKPAGEPAARGILEKVAAETQARIAPAVLPRLLELSEFGNVSAALPGRAVELLRRIVGGLADPARPIADKDILHALRLQTGVPLELLDDTIKLDRAELREFFETRVMGQPEAVDAAVDLVTLIKAGLTDPHKPFGVLLFVGPTGVGKTELARALAEYCFGSPNRLIRLDMSEYASYEAYERLIGKTGQAGSLTSLVREQPFSILLFDELEKGHLNVYDLCLQIFDAGRLTDGRGQVADFRRTIIVLTSNVGAAVAQGEPIGFGPTRPADAGESQSNRDLRRTFRPEFLNRIDRIVQFQSLSEETAERIIRREVNRVLERSGIKRRNLTIDSDPSLLPLLLREGYSRTYGARPLKRAIERLILLPLARAIAAGEVRHDSLVRLLVRNGSVRVQLQAIEEAEKPPAPVVVQPAPADALARIAALEQQIALFREQAAELSARKAAVLAQTAAPRFWDTPRESRQIYEQIYVLDGVLAQVEALRKAVQRAAETLALPGNHKHTLRVRARLDALESQAAQVALLLACRDLSRLGDAIVTVTRVGGKGEPLGGVERLAGMYQRFGRRRHFEVQVLDDHHWDSPPDDSITLLIGGVGAHVMLANEAGLHVLSRSSYRLEAGKDTDREVLRVDVGLVDSSQPAIERNNLRVNHRALTHVKGRLLRRPRIDVELLHLPSMVSLRAWTDGDESVVLERLMPLLQARIQASQQAAAGGWEDALVRRYRLGPSQLVRDARTGRKSGRLKALFDGHLDGFLLPLVPPTEPG